MHRLRRRLLAVFPGLAAVGLTVLLAACVASADTAAADDDIQIRSQVEAMFNLQMQMTILPAGSEAGRVAPDSMTAVQQRIATELPKVMTGKLLTAQTQGYLHWLSDVQKDPTTGVSTEAHVDSMTFDGPAVISGSSATISGSFVWRFNRYHIENNARVPDGARGASSFTAQFTRINGTWLISAITRTEMGAEPLGTMPPWLASPPTLAPGQSLATKPPVPSGPVSSGLHLP